MSLDQQQVLALAPDAASAAAGKKLARPGVFEGLGQSAQAFWGQCQGSALYQVQVDRSDLTGKCSCPSRKFPCKHVLGLLLIVAENADALPSAETPDFVLAWLEKRQGAAEKKAQKAEAPAAEVDLVAQAKRVALRQQRVAEGLDALELWMADLLRSGLALLSQQSPKIWRDQAARLVDAQAPALAGRIGRLAELPGSGRDWAGTLLAELGRIGLLIAASRRLDELPEGLRADVRHAIGWTTSTDEVLSEGERLSDQWLVASRQVEDDGRVRWRRFWLHGLASGRSALILQFSVAGQSFGTGKEVGGALLPGTLVDAELAFFPSAFPQRALFRESRGVRLWDAAADPFPGTSSFRAFFDDLATALAAQPFISRMPALFPALVPTLVDGRLFLVDTEGAAVPAHAPEPWRLVALAGGKPLGFALEWQDLAFQCLSCCSDSLLEPLSGEES